MSQYQAWSVVYNEQPTTAKWNILGTNGDYFNNALPQVGFIMWFWGNSASIPGYYKMCNGQTISDSESPLNGVTLPNLVNKFIRAVTSGNVRTTPVTGGADSHDHGLGFAGGHNHIWGYNGALNAYDWYTFDVFGSGRQLTTGSRLINTGYSSSGTYVIGTENGLSAAVNFHTDTQGSHVHTVTTQSNVPAYQGLVPVMRFK